MCWIDVKSGGKCGFSLWNFSVDHFFLSQLKEKVVCKKEPTCNILLEINRINNCYREVTIDWQWCQYWWQACCQNNFGCGGIPACSKHAIFKWFCWSLNRILIKLFCIKGAFAIGFIKRNKIGLLMQFGWG